MNILCNIDDNFKTQLGVMLTSLFVNNRSQQITIYCVQQELSDKSKSELSNLVEKYNQTIVFVNAPTFGIEFPNIKADNTNNITEAAYLRLFVTEYLSKDINKILYLDADIIIRGSIESFYNTNIDGYACAAIPDLPHPHTNSYKRLNIPETEKYVNSGVLLFNLDYLRDIDFSTKSLEFIKHNKSLPFHDQDVINALLCGKIIYVSEDYNYMSIRKKEDHSNPVIAHFAGTLSRPWYCPYRVRFGKEWAYYLSLSGLETPKYSFSELINLFSFSKALKMKTGYYRLRSIFK